jgi:hypothetical protein
VDLRDGSVFVAVVFDGGDVAVPLWFTKAASFLDMVGDEGAGVEGVEEVMVDAADTLNCFEIISLLLHCWVASYYFIDSRAS